MINSLLIKHCQLFRENDIFEGDVFIKNGKIHAVDWHIDTDAEQIINGSHLLLLPGIIDTHVHFREPGLTEKETLYSGSKCAVSGGVTTFFDMPNTTPSTTTHDTLAQKKELASKTSLANYNFYIGATAENLETLNTVDNCPGIKIYVGSSTGDLHVSDPEVLDRIFANGDRLILVHSEDDNIIAQNHERLKDQLSSENPHLHYKLRSPEAALKTTVFLSDLAQKHQRNLHFLHITSQEETIFLSKTTSPFITAEVCPHHLFLRAPEDYDRLDTLIKMNPPIREKYHQDALWKGLYEGVFTTLGSDHAPHTLSEKQQAYSKAPAGMPGVAYTLPLCLDQIHHNKLSLQQFVSLTASGPAKRFHIQNKGKISAGYDADLILIDLNGQTALKASHSPSLCGWSPFEDTTCKGQLITTIVNGQIVYQEGDFFEDIKGQEVRIQKASI